MSIPYNPEAGPVLVIVVSMLAVLILSGLVVLYVSFHRRGTPVPGANWLGEAMSHAVGSLPIVTEEENDHNASEVDTDGHLPVDELI